MLKGNELPQFCKAWRTIWLCRPRRDAGLCKRSCCGVGIPPSASYDEKEPGVAGNGHDDILVRREIHQLLLSSYPDILGDPLPQENRVVDWPRQGNAARSADRKRRHR